MMRRNSGLFERMKSGDAAAWDDPGAMLEVMVHGSEADFVHGAFVAGGRLMHMGRSWTDNQWELILAVVKGNWDRVPTDWKVDWCFEAAQCDQYGETHKDLVLFLNQCFLQAAGVDATEEGRKVSKGLKSWCLSKVREKCKVKVPLGGRFLVENYGDIVFREAANLLRNAVEIAHYSWNREGIDVTQKAIRACGEDFVNQSFSSMFPDPVIWVPDTMSRNRRRR